MRAVELYEQALARTPDDPLILSDYAIAKLKEVMYSDNSQTSSDTVRAVADKALAIAPDLPEAHLASGAVALGFGEVERAAREIRIAARGERRLADAYAKFGGLSLEVDRIEEGIKHLDVALSLEPRDLWPRTEIARAYELLGRPQIADEWFSEVPADPQLRPLYWVQRARMIYWRRDFESARKLLAQQGDLAPVFRGKSILESMENPAVFEEIVAHMDDNARIGGAALRRTAMFRQIKAELLAFRGDEDAAIAAAVDAERAGLFDIAWCTRCPLLDALRKRKEFQEVMFRVGERAARVRAALGLT